MLFVLANGLLFKLFASFIDFIAISYVIYDDIVCIIFKYVLNSSDIEVESSFVRMLVLMSNSLRAVLRLESVPEVALPLIVYVLNDDIALVNIVDSYCRVLSFCCNILLFSISIFSSLSFCSITVALISLRYVIICCCFNVDKYIFSKVFFLVAFIFRAELYTFKED